MRGHREAHRPPSCRSVDHRQVQEIVDYFGDEASLVILGQPVVETRGQEEALGRVIVAEGLAVTLDGVAALLGGPTATSKSWSSTVPFSMAQSLACPQRNRECCPVKQFTRREVGAGGSEPMLLDQQA